MGHLRLSPPACSVLFQVVLIVIGGLVPWTPIPRTGQTGVGEAIFTSTSIVMVTGLVLVDIGSVFTGVGQAVIALLIQLEALV